MNELMKALAYNFKNEELLRLALTHSSTVKNSAHIGNCNQRLEFLGDAVLQLVVSKRLYDKYPNKSEGELTKLRIQHVCKSALVGIASMLDLGKYLLLDSSLEAMGGRSLANNLEDALEAVFAAVYLDGGIEKTSLVINNIYNQIPDLDNIIPKNSKGELQEFLQSKAQNLPEYKLVHESGPDHNKTFTVEVIIDGIVLCSAESKSIRNAEQLAAEATLLKLLKEKEQ